MADEMKPAVELEKAARAIHARAEAVGAASGSKSSDTTQPRRKRARAAFGEACNTGLVISTIRRTGRLDAPSMPVISSALAGPAAGMETPD